MTTQESIDVRNGSGANVSIVETSKLLPWMFIVCLLSGFSLAASIYVNVQYAQAYKELERENRLAQLEIDDFRIAMIRAGIEIEEHKP